MHFLSSTIVKEIASFGKDVSNWVPKVVEDKLKEKVWHKLIVKRVRKKKYTVGNNKRQVN